MDNEFDNLSAAELEQVTSPLSESDRVRLTEFYTHLIAAAGAELPGVREVPPGEARRARRTTRQRAGRLVRILSPARRTAPAEGVAA